MAAIDAIRTQLPSGLLPSALDVATTPGALDARQDEETLGVGGLHRLLNSPSTLDRLVGDAGPLGKFRTDDPDRMPSGTASLTLRSGDALNRLAARLGIPGERILSGNPSFHPERPDVPPAELPRGDAAARGAQGVTADAMQPADASGTENRTGAIDRGNRRDGDA